MGLYNRSRRSMLDKDRARYLIPYCLLLIIGCSTSTPREPDDETDTTFLKIYFDHSEDLAETLDGITLYQKYVIRCNDGKDRSVKVALLDRGKGRVGFVVDTGIKATGARAYTSNSVAFVTLEWFQKARQVERIALVALEGVQ